MADNSDDKPKVRTEDGNILSRIAQAVGRPLLLHPTKAEVVLNVLHGRIGVDVAQASLPVDANRFMGSNRREDGWSINPAYEGVGIVSVVGSLVNRGAWIGTNSGLVSYEGITAQLNAAAADDEVHSIALDIDSFGGEATGMFAVAERVRFIDQNIKPVVAVINDVACSAGYGIASGAREIIVSPTSMVGSIGVVLLHLDRSGEMAQKGIKPTFVYAGKHKVDGNPFGPLSEQVQKDLAAEIEDFYSLFVASVAMGRGDRLTEEDARATEARVYTGQKAIDIGLADRIASFDAVLTELATEQPYRASLTKGRHTMSTKTNAQAADQGISQEEHDKAIAAAREEGRQAGLTEGKAIGADAERERIASVLNSEHAKGREQSAIKLALTQGLPAETAAATLADLPKAASIGSRAAAENELGGPANDAGGNQPEDAPSADATNDRLWGAALKRVNGK